MKNIDVFPLGHGNYRVLIKFRGVIYGATTQNMPAIDAYKNLNGSEKQHGYTKRTASIALFNEVKSSNNLNTKSHGSRHTKNRR